MTGYSDSTPLVLSNDANSLGIIGKTTEKVVIVFFSTGTTVERPHEFAYARMPHDRVQLPLASCIKPGTETVKQTKRSETNRKPHTNMWWPGRTLRVGFRVGSGSGSGASGSDPGRGGSGAGSPLVDPMRAREDELQR